MVKSISVSNFKSLKNLFDFELKPLTIITGLNSSGKSNILEAISFFGQASRLTKIKPSENINIYITYREGDVKRYPIDVINYISYRQIETHNIMLKIVINANKKTSDFIFNEMSNSNVLMETLFEETHEGIDTIGYSYIFNLSNRNYSQEIYLNNKILIKVDLMQGQQTTVSYPTELTGRVTIQSADSILNPRVFRSSTHPILDFISNIAEFIINEIKYKTSGIYYLSGERGTINPEYNLPSGRNKLNIPTWVGHKGEHLIEILSRCQTRRPNRFSLISKWAQKFGLSQLRAGLGELLFEANYRDDILNAQLNSTLAGLGTRQILAIITQLFWSKEGDTILIEEPETSLHPENQVLLYDLFSEAIMQGKQIICSTHSPFFVLALSKIIKDGKMNIDDILVYHIKKGKKGTEYDVLELNDKGFIVGGIPSFMKVELDLFNDWSESLDDEV
jgi:AAA15 family ATPase/GTPase